MPSAAATLAAQRISAQGVRGARDSARGCSAGSVGSLLPTNVVCSASARVAAKNALQGLVLRGANGAAVSRSATVVRAANKPWAPRDCRLVLSDGTVFEGRSFGATGTVVAEVVFNTSLTGYQEIMSDPSYAGQMVKCNKLGRERQCTSLTHGKRLPPIGAQFVCFTHPHIGNVGTNGDDMECEKCHMKGIIVRDRPTIVSNYRSKMDIDAFCKDQGIVGIADIDTRALTRIVREYGCLNGVITSDMTKSVEELAAMAKAFDISATDYIAEVTTKKPYEFTDATEDEWEFAANAKASRNMDQLHIVAYDFGIKRNILKRLASYNCRVTVVPASTTAADVLAMNPDGIFFSNGPGDPSVVTYAVEAAKELVGKKPCFGICMGHQVMGQALGSKTFKLKFGHHGGNHPIRFGPTGRTEISAQNHNYAVDPSMLPEDVSVTHINLNDGTCAGLMSASRKCLSIQYHPEASPGPHDADVCFDMFIELVRAEKQGRSSETLEKYATAA